LTLELSFMAEIKWFGHACFRIRGKDVTVLTDPVPRDTGYDLGAQSADIVTVSHDHHGHTALDLISPGYRLVNGPGEYEIQEVFITGVTTFHDAERGRLLGKNTVYLIEIEDLIVCHLGDLGHVLTEPQVEAMSAVDVLIVPVGGPPTINSAQAAEVIGQLEPGVIVPMQFRTERGDHQRESLERFVKEMGLTEYEQLDRLVLKKSDAGGSPRVVILQPA
jgi:L-ascorbate metabolism protein UlaG (beta-lactamase superfamily)